MGSGVVQLVEQSLLTPDVRGLNPVIGMLKLPTYCQLYWKDENIEKEAWKSPFEKSIAPL